MAQITVPGQTITPGAVRTSASHAIPAQITGAAVRMTDPSGQWATKTGSVVIWGVQASADGFVTWRWLVFSTGIAFGTLEKDGGLPSLSVSNDLLVAAAGESVRLGVQVDATITLGATITTTP